MSNDNGVASSNAADDGDVDARINGVDGGAATTAGDASAPSVIAGDNDGEPPLSVCSIYGDGGAVAKSGKMDGNIAAPMNGVNPLAGRSFMPRLVLRTLLLFVVLLLLMVRVRDASIAGGEVTRMRSLLLVDDGDDNN